MTNERIELELRMERLFVPAHVLGWSSNIGIFVRIGCMLRFQWLHEARGAFRNT